MVIHILTIVFAPVGPCENTVSMHLVQVPVTAKLATIFPNIHSFTMDIVLGEVSIKFVSIVPLEHASSILEAVDVAANVDRAIRPCFFALSMLFVLVPLAFIAGTIGMRVHSNALGHIVQPLSFVDVAVSVDQAAAALCLVLFEPAFVNVAVSVDQATAALCLVLLEPAFVNGSIFENLFAFAFSNHGSRNPLALIFNTILSNLLRPDLKLIVTTIHGLIFWHEFEGTQFLSD